VITIAARARVERAAGNGHGAERRADAPELALAPETLAAAPHLENRPPDLIVDATGRARQSSRVLGIPARVGPRRDVAHFAHFEGFRWDDVDGQVLIAPGKAGWSWCIPLRDRLSVGIVLGQDDAARLGRSPEERLANAIDADPWLTSVVGLHGRRVTSVATYSNYQLISERGVGPGWVAVGDAFGFVDPMLSPGVFLSLRSAELVAEGLTPILQARTPASPALLAARLQSYARTHTAALAAWWSLVEQLYDGRMLALMRAGRDFVGNGSGMVKDALQNHIERHIALQASGIGTTRRYSRTLLRFLGRHGLRGVRPADYAIR
jgi:flavin-dependent dehydrogenase